MARHSLSVRVISNVFAEDDAAKLGKPMAAIVIDKKVRLFIM